MLAVAVPGSPGVRVERFDDDGSALDASSDADARGVASLDERAHPRWIFDSTVASYPALLESSVRIQRCHDIALTERLLLGRLGRFGEPCRAAAVLARADGQPVPPDPEDLGRRDTSIPEPGLFDSGGDRTTPPLRPADLVRAYLDQQRRIAPSAASSGITALTVPAGALRLLVAAESASALVAAEMTARGLPWDAEVHRRILVDKLGPRPADGRRPRHMADIAQRISDAFGFDVNPDSALDLREAFQRVGFDVPSTRAWVLRNVDHPAVAPVLEYKDLARLYTANGWNWLDEWVADGRLQSEYLPGAVVSGRWATHGGGGLQLPRSVRAAAVAQPGYTFVVADAAQLEPRVWAAVSRDPGLVDATGDDDMYEAIARAGFGGDRAHAKLAMLGGMYGQTSGEAARLMATMRTRYPAAVGYVEQAARAGESGSVVRSVLGRACPPPPDSWRRLVGGTNGDDDRAARRASRDRGRFTRNFVIQASASDWTAVWMSGLRLALMGVAGAEIVFFQHDELVMHVPTESADMVSDLTLAAAREATRLVFPGTRVVIPVRPVVVRCYADAK